jgi:N-acetylmuramic acid 6-phosphate (MurNAc-6-P) etherase
MNGILSLLKIAPGPQSIDYVQEKTQYQLHTLLTERRHPKTWNLSTVIKQDIQAGLEQIFEVDQDIADTFLKLAEDPILLEQAAKAVKRALQNQKKIFVYGCGATGRLAKVLESAVWRPFWRAFKQTRLWNKLSESLPDNIEDFLIGELTGGDRALICSLEGFEDLEIVGQLQLQDHGIERGDVVFCITEGGETSSVIGAAITAWEQYGEPPPKIIEEAANNLYFIYNNPDDVLLPFERSRKVLSQPGITKINLTTGPQAITGSTRMQATTSETYIMGIILEAGICAFLQGYLTVSELKELGFAPDISVKEKLLAFARLLKLIHAQSGKIAKLTTLEAATYKKGKRSTYLAQKAVVTVFTDCTERSPTFHLFPLDTIHETERRCWLQVLTKGEEAHAAWQYLLGRPFKGMERSHYYEPFYEKIQDGYLRQTALDSLSQAGKDQMRLYDFSFSSARGKRAPQPEDLGVLVCMDKEVSELADKASLPYRFVDLVKSSRAHLALILAHRLDEEAVENTIMGLPLDPEKDVVLNFRLDRQADPLGLDGQVLIKMILNAHSTGVMAVLGRVVGNSMTNVNPSNLKLIGRATYLVLAQVNETLSQEAWILKYGKSRPLRYAEANAVLMAAMGYVSELTDQTSEVELSIIRILEAVRGNEHISWEKALELKRRWGLEKYLAELTIDDR